MPFTESENATPSSSKIDDMTSATEKSAKESFLKRISGILKAKRQVETETKKGEATLKVRLIARGAHAER